MATLLTWHWHQKTVEIYPPPLALQAQYCERTWGHWDYLVGLIFHLVQPPFKDWRSMADMQFVQFGWNGGNSFWAVFEQTTHIPSCYNNVSHWREIVDTRIIFYGALYHLRRAIAMFTLMFTDVYGWSTKETRSLVSQFQVEHFCCSRSAISVNLTLWTVLHWAKTKN